MTPKEAMAVIHKEKLVLEKEILSKIKEFEEKYNVFVAFIRNVHYIKMNGDEETRDIKLDIKI